MILADYFWPLSKRSDCENGAQQINRKLLLLRIIYITVPTIVLSICLTVLFRGCCLEEQPEESKSSVSDLTGTSDSPISAMMTALDPVGGLPQSLPLEELFEQLTLPTHKLYDYLLNTGGHVQKIEVIDFQAYFTVCINRPENDALIETVFKDEFKLTNSICYWELIIFIYRLRFMNCNDGEGFDRVCRNIWDKLPKIHPFIVVNDELGKTSEEMCIKLVENEPESGKYLMEALDKYYQQMSNSIEPVNEVIEELKGQEEGLKQSNYNEINNLVGDENLVEKNKFRNEFTPNKFLKQPGGGGKSGSEDDGYKSQNLSENSGSDGEGSGGGGGGEGGDEDEDEKKGVSNSDSAFEDVDKQKGSTIKSLKKVYTKKKSKTKKSKQRTKMKSSKSQVQTVSDIPHTTLAKSITLPSSSTTQREPEIKKYPFQGAIGIKDIREDLEGIENQSDDGMQVLSKKFANVNIDGNSRTRKSLDDIDLSLKGNSSVGIWKGTKKLSRSLKYINESEHIQFQEDGIKSFKTLRNPSDRAANLISPNPDGYESAPDVITSEPLPDSHLENLPALISIFEPIEPFPIVELKQRRFSFSEIVEFELEQTLVNSKYTFQENRSLNNSLEDIIDPDTIPKKEDFKEFNKKRILEVNVSELFTIGARYKFKSQPKLLANFFLMSYDIRPDLFQTYPSFESVEIEKTQQITLRIKSKFCQSRRDFYKFIQQIEYSDDCTDTTVSIDFINDPFFNFVNNNYLIKAVVRTQYGLKLVPSKGKVRPNMYHGPFLLQKATLGGVIFEVQKMEKFAHFSDKKIISEMEYCSQLDWNSEFWKSGEKRSILEPTFLHLLQKHDLFKCFKHGNYYDTENLKVFSPFFLKEIKIFNFGGSVAGFNINSFLTYQNIYDWKISVDKNPCLIRKKLIQSENFLHKYYDLSKLNAEFASEELITQLLDYKAYEIADKEVVISKAMRPIGRDVFTQELRYIPSKYVAVQPMGKRVNLTMCSKYSIEPLLEIMLKNQPKILNIVLNPLATGDNSNT